MTYISWEKIHDAIDLIDTVIIDIEHDESVQEVGAINRLKEAKAALYEQHRILVKQFVKGVVREER